MPEVLSQIKEAVVAIASTEVSTKVPETPPMDSSNGLVYGIGSIGAAIVTTLLFLRRKLPSDTLAITKDRVEGELLTKVMAERDAAVRRADEFATTHSADAGEIAGLKARNLYLQEEVVRLNKLVDKMEKQFDELKASVRSLGHESRKPIPPSPSPDTQTAGPTTKF